MAAKSKNTVKAIVCVFAAPRNSLCLFRRHIKESRPQILQDDGFSVVALQQLVQLRVLVVVYSSVLESLIFLENFFDFISVFAPFVL